jgi:hypothetical protein
MHTTSTHARILHFTPTPLALVLGQVLERLARALDDMAGWCDDFPPIQQPMRFGNKAYRQWHARLVERAPGIVASLLPAGPLAAAAAELAPYLLDAFGNSVRIDYGTGHETCFVILLCERRARAAPRAAGRAIARIDVLL